MLLENVWPRRRRRVGLKPLDEVSDNVRAWNRNFLFMTGEQKVGDGQKISMNGTHSSWTTSYERASSEHNFTKRETRERNKPRMTKFAKTATKSAMLRITGPARASTKEDWHGIIKFKSKEKPTEMTWISTADHSNSMLIQCVAINLDQRIRWMVVSQEEQMTDNCANGYESVDVGEIPCNVVLGGVE